MNGESVARQLRRHHGLHQVLHNQDDHEQDERFGHAGGPERDKTGKSRRKDGSEIWDV